MDHAAFFEIGRTYPHLTGSYEVVAIDGDWLACRLEDGREVRVTTLNAFRALDAAGCFAKPEGEETPRLRHDCVGRPCGPMCVKRAGTEEVGEG